MRLRVALALAWSLAAVSCTSSSLGVTTPSEARCQVSVQNSITANAPSAGMSGTLALTTARDCTWTVTSTAAWAQITENTSGQGDGTIGYKILENPDAIQRRATFAVNNVQVPVTQDAAACRFSVAPPNATVPAEGGTVSVTITTLNGCAWTAASDSPWLTIAGPSSGSASATTTLRAAANAGLERAATVRIAGLSVV